MIPQIKDAEYINVWSLSMVFVLQFCYQESKLKQSKVHKEMNKHDET